MNKRGVSEIVATVLIVMLTVAAVGIIWVGIIPLVKENIGSSDVCKKVDISIETTQGYTCYSSSNITLIQIKKGSNDVNVSGVKFYLSSEGNSIPFTTKDSLKRNSFSVFYLNTTGISKFEKIEVAPIVKSGNSEKVCAVVYVTQPLSACSSALTEEEVAKITHGGGHVINQDPIVIMSCVPNCSCADSVAVGETCSDGCGGMTCQGTKQDGTVSYPYVITNCTQLQNMNQNLSANYVLANNIDCSIDTRIGGSLYNSGAGFTPVGNYTTSFSGNFNGRGFVISDLIINRSLANPSGLFGYILGNISNVGMINVDVTGYRNVGGLAGDSEGFINNSYVFGNVTATTELEQYSYCGVLAGNGKGVSNSYSAGNVLCAGSVGGLVGYQYAGGRISNSNSSARVMASFYAGGLVGWQVGGEIINSYSLGDINGSRDMTQTFGGIGGLVGVVGSGIINMSFCSGNVIGSGVGVGGLAGNLFTVLGGNPGARISNSYSTGNVTNLWTQYTGGFVGFNSGAQLISNSYSMGNVSAASNSLIGGFIGVSSAGTITSSFWDNETSGKSTSAGTAIGKITAQMKNQTVFTNAGWNFTNIWAIDSVKNNGYPYLRWQNL